MNQPEESRKPEQAVSSQQPEGQPAAPSSPPEERQEHRRQRRTSVFTYLAVLFAAAFTMLFMAYLMQERANDAALGSLMESITSYESLNTLIEENQALHAERDALEEQLQKARESADAWQEKYQQQAGEGAAAEKQAEAWAVLWQIEYCYGAGELEECAALCRQLSACAGAIGDEAALARLREIFDALAAEGYVDEALGAALFPEASG